IGRVSTRRPIASRLSWLTTSPPYVRARGAHGRRSRAGHRSVVANASRVGRTPAEPGRTDAACAWTNPGPAARSSRTSDDCRHAPAARRQGPAHPYLVRVLRPAGARLQPEPRLQPHLGRPRARPSRLAARLHVLLGSRQPLSDLAAPAGRHTRPLAVGALAEL